MFVTACADLPNVLAKSSMLSYSGTLAVRVVVSVSMCPDFMLPISHAVLNCASESSMLKLPFSCARCLASSSVSPFSP